jgi:SAM-dependent methyltransferase
MVMRLPLRVRRLLGRFQAPAFDGSRELAALLEPIRWDEDVLQDVGDILAPLDLAELERLRQRYRTASPAPGYSKYLDVATYVALHLRHARRLGLATPGGPPRRVLDIGTGTGYFPYVCGRFGHQAVGIDLGEIPMYDDFVRLLRVERITWRVTPFVPLPAFAAPFDCVTAMQMKFNGRPQGGAWGEPEWSFFLRDLARRVAHPGAQVFLEFNADRSGVAVPPELAAYLRSAGARIDGATVHFASLRGLVA